MEFTHNLKLLLVDKEKKVVMEDEAFLDEIKDILCQNNTCILDWNGKTQPFTYQWHKRNLTEVESQLMGDLFSRPIYEFDTILVRHVEQILSKIVNQEYTIVFYVTRLIGDKRISSDSAGTIKL